MIDTENEMSTPQLTPSSQQLPVDRQTVEPLQNLSLKENEVVYAEGDMPRGLYFIKSGAVKVYVNRKRARGRISSPEFMTKVLGPGDIFGYQALIKSSPHSEVVKTLKSTELSIYSKESVMTSLRPGPVGQPSIAQQLMSQMVKDLERKEKDGELHYLASVQERIAYQLVLLADKFGVNSDRGIHIDLKLTRNELAQLAGTINESLSRHLTELKAEGIIELAGKEIIVKNKAALFDRSGNFSGRA
jgi:CRP-like cAMP-binding protein